MIDIQQVLPVLQRVMPKATPQQLIDAVQKAEAAIPNLTAQQLFALIHKYIQMTAKKAPFTGLVGGLTPGVK